MRYWFRKTIYAGDEAPSAIIGEGDRTVAVVFGETEYDAIADAQTMAAALNERAKRVEKTYQEMKEKQHG